MTRQQATDFIEKLKQEYGDDYMNELGRRTGCNPENHDAYGMVYCMHFNCLSRGFAAERSRAMKGHGEMLFREGVKRKNKTITESRLDQIIRQTIKEEIDTGQLSSASERKGKRKESDKEREARKKLRDLRKRIYDADDKELKRIHSQIDSIQREMGWRR